MLKGQVMPQEIRDKISKSNMGKVASPETILKRIANGKARIGEKAGNWQGGYYSKQHYCKDCNIPISRWAVRGNGRCNKCSKRICSKRDSANHLWRGGITPLKNHIRTLYQYADWRKGVFTRDSFTCQECQIKGGELQAHHIISLNALVRVFLREYNQFSPIEDSDTLIRLTTSYKPFWEVSNGITLCVKCHHLLPKK